MIVQVCQVIYVLFDNCIKFYENICISRSHTLWFLERILVLQKQVRDHRKAREGESTERKQSVFQMEACKQRCCVPWHFGIISRIVFSSVSPTIVSTGERLTSDITVTAIKSFSGCAGSFSRNCQKLLRRDSVAGDAVLWNCFICTSEVLLKLFKKCRGKCSKCN